MIYQKPNCAALKSRVEVYQCMCMMSDTLVNDGKITDPGSRQEAFASKLSMLSCSSHTRLTFFFVSILSFASGFSWA